MAMQCSSANHAFGRPVCTTDRVLRTRLTSVMVWQQAPIEVLHIGMGTTPHAGWQHRDGGLGFPLHRGTGGDVSQCLCVCCSCPTPLSSSEMGWVHDRSKGQDAGLIVNGHKAVPNSPEAIAQSRTAPKYGHA